MKQEMNTAQKAKKGAEVVAIDAKKEAIFDRKIGENRSEIEAENSSTTGGAK